MHSRVRFPATVGSFLSLRMRLRAFHRGLRWQPGWLGWIVGVLFLSLTLSRFLEATEDRSPRPPNILMIITDDQGEWTLGCNGNPDAMTPHLDQLASQGMQLKKAFAVTPVCSPSRLATMTGRYASEFGISDWIDPKTEPHLGIPSATPTWPKRLQDAGYRTGLIGKWHLGTQPAFHPTLFGYQSFSGFLGGGIATKNPLLEVDGETKSQTGLSVELITSMAIAFLEQSKQQHPWCLSVHYREPHAAYLPVEESIWSRYESKEVALPEYPNLDRELVKRKMRAYLASIAGVDQQVGRILKRLDDLGMRQETLIVFTSDHGYNLGHHGLEFKGNAYWRLEQPPAQEWPGIAAECRPNLFDTSLRVPAIVCWPEVIPSGGLCHELTTNLDWFPTFCEAAQIPLNHDEQTTMRGKSLLPFWRDSNAQTATKELFFEYSMHHGSTADMRAIRTTDWKFVRDFRYEGRVELYDLRTDPEERSNLADSNQAIHQSQRRQLEERLMEHLKQIADPIVATASR